MKIFLTKALNKYEHFYISENAISLGKYDQFKNSNAFSIKSYWKVQKYCVTVKKVRKVASSNC